METWPVTEDILVDDTLTIEVISKGDLMKFCSILFLLVEELETGSESVSKIGNNSFVFIMISDCDLIDFCSILLFAIVELETWPVTKKKFER